MFAKRQFSTTLTPDELDRYLELGWFRMQQTIFTTNFLIFHNKFYSAVWLRVGLNNYMPDKKQKEIFKLNKHFRTEIKKAAITPENEALYSIYKEGISFQPSSTLQQLLFGGEQFNRFDSYEVNVYDGDILIATGFFDLGKTSAEGISCFYHPDYKKHSLGKYLMYLKIEFCREKQLDFFYPGYIVPGYAPFEYKSAIGKATLEYLSLSTGEWLPYSEFSENTNPLELISRQLKALQKHLQLEKIETELKFYRFFDAGLDPSCDGLRIFDYPIFLQYKLNENKILFKVIVYDVRDNSYHFIQCKSIATIDFYEESDLIFNKDLLIIDKELFVVGVPDEKL